MSENAPYNPLDKENLGKSVADALLERAPIQMEALMRPVRGYCFTGFH